MDVKQPSPLSLQPNISSKDDTDVTSSIEYKRAQENLLSASEKVAGMSQMYLVPKQPSFTLQAKLGNFVYCYLYAS